MQKIQEGMALFYAPKEQKVSKKLPVFYNPVMKLNRDISISLLNSLSRKKMNIALPLAGTGVRGLRLAKELKKGIAEKINMNDSSDNAVKLMKKNIKLNKISAKKAIITQKDANIFLLESTGFDYIDIDPFGTPNPFLDAAVKRIARGGILAVTATDTSALAGTYPDACMRKYWAVPKNDELKHETGLRILIRKCQLIGAQHSKALIPIYSYSIEHYMRVFFICEKGKTKVGSIIEQHGPANEAGPMWLGELWDSKLAEKIAKNMKTNMAEAIAEESKIPSIGFHDIHSLCKKSKTAGIPPFETIIKEIRKKKKKASRTHFSSTGIRSNIEEDKLLKIIKGNAL